MTVRVLALIALVAALVAPATGLRAQVSVNPQFFGTWCAQGDPTRPASIATSATGVQATNEQGSTSAVLSWGMNGNSIVAPAWMGVRGSLNGSANRIVWTNGTFWARCDGDRPSTLSGTWYAQGDRTRACAIVQRNGRLRLTNEQGVAADGWFDGPAHLIAVWNGTRIGATLHRGARRIDWDNGTFWVRQ